MQDCKGTRPAVNQVTNLTIISSHWVVRWIELMINLEFSYCQVELHPHYNQKQLVEFCNKEGIHVQAYSSLGTSTNTSLLKDPTVSRIAGQLKVSPARLLLKWALQQGIGAYFFYNTKQQILTHFAPGITSF